MGFAWRRRHAPTAPWCGSSSSVAAPAPARSSAKRACDLHPVAGRGGLLRGQRPVRGADAAAALRRAAQQHLAAACRPCPRCTGAAAEARDPASSFQCSTFSNSQQMPPEANNPPVLQTLLSWSCHANVCVSANACRLLRCCPATLNEMYGVRCACILCLSAAFPSGVCLLECESLECFPTSAFQHVSAKYTFKISSAASKHSHGWAPLL